MPLPEGVSVVSSLESQGNKYKVGLVFKGSRKHSGDHIGHDFVRQSLERVPGIQTVGVINACDQAIEHNEGDMCCVVEITITQDTDTARLREAVQVALEKSSLPLLDNEHNPDTVDMVLVARAL